MNARVRQPAFTLVELLASLAASALLMLAVLTVVAHLGRDALRARGRTAISRADAPSDAVWSLLRWDLLHGRQLQSDPDGKWIVIKGFGGIDPATRAPSARPALVRYRIVQQGGASLLLRDQRYRDDPRQPRAWSDLVSGSVTSLSMRPLVPARAANPDAPRATFGDMTDVPDAVRVTLGRTRQAEPDEQIMILH